MLGDISFSLLRKSYLPTNFHSHPYSCLSWIIPQCCKDVFMVFQGLLLLMLLIFFFFLLITWKKKLTVYPDRAGVSIPAEETEEQTFINLSLMMTSAEVVVTSVCYRPQFFRTLSPGPSNYTITWYPGVQTIFLVWLRRRTFFSKIEKRKFHHSTLLLHFYTGKLFRSLNPHSPPPPLSLSFSLSFQMLKKSHFGSIG